VRGDVVNDLFELVIDPNVHIPESKVTTCRIVPGQKSHGLTAAVDGPLAIAGGDPGPDALLLRDLPNVGQKTPEPPQVKQEK
jgi:formate dehydrogenase major subunit